MTFNILLLTGEQIRAGRALARIEQTELARSAGLSLETIKRLERIRGPVQANARTLRAIQRAFDDIGIGFHGDESGTAGVVWRPALTATAPTPSPVSTPAARLRRIICHGPLSAPVGTSLRPIMAGLYQMAGDLGRDHGVTGLIRVEDGLVLLALEGEPQAVETAYQALRRGGQPDPLSLLDDRPAGQAVFHDMGFCCGVFPDDLRSASQAGRLGHALDPARLSATDAIALLMEARSRQQAMPRNGCLIPSACVLSSQCLDRRCNDSSERRNPQLTPQVQ